MKPTAILVNIGRGLSLDEDALILALNEGKIAGAALDVQKNEPLQPDNPLWTANNLLISPHNADWYEESALDVANLFLRNVREFQAVEKPSNLVDKELGY